MTGGAAAPDAAALYNAGTAALGRGEIGEAVAFLLAARRIDPRAADARRNLAIAERAVSRGRGEAAPPMPRGPALELSAAEGWWLAAILLAIGAAAGITSIVAGAGIRAKSPARAAWLGRGAVALGLAGLLASAGLAARAIAERRHPEAVVVVMSVEARRGVDETPRTPILLREGERVRTGRIRGDDVEVFIGGSPIGWVPRAALWNVADAARYTPGFRSR